jgi:hypothetical protein
MDPSLSVVIITAGSILKGPVEEFLKRIGGPAGDEIGGWLCDKVRDYRGTNVKQAVVSAQSMLAEAGGEIREVPLRSLLPIMEGASIEDNPELAARWAALLANAADARGQAIPPIMPAILQQLTPFDAKALTRIDEIFRAGLVEDPLPPGRPREHSRWGVRKNEISLDQSFPDQPDAAVDTLVALGLVEREPSVRNENGLLFTTGLDELRLTALGRHFLSACSPPSRSGAQAS